MDTPLRSLPRLRALVTQMPPIAAGTLLALLGGLIVLISPFFTWDRIDIVDRLRPQYSVSGLYQTGFDGGDGWFCIALAAVVIAFALWLLLAGRGTLASINLLIMGAAAAFLTVAEFLDLPRKSNDSGNVLVHHGASVGLYILGVGALLILAGGVTRILVGPRRSALSQTD